jgi:2-polyprenyl-6-methoxyphenol hydroxylase-like FAD-dependent oxidoreductase
MDVLIAGGGTVGLAAAVFLARHGIAATVVERQPGPSVHPRATGVSPRTVELLHEAGLFDAVNAAAVGAAGWRLGKLTAPSLAEAGFPSAGNAPPAGPATSGPGGNPFAAFSPRMLRGTCPQNRLDNVLLAAARERGARVEYATELTSVTQDASGVTAELAGRDGRRTVTARYLIAADGARSGIRRSLGIDLHGPGTLGAPIMNILFRADLREVTRGCTFVACETPAGVIITIDGEKEWVLHAPYQPGQADQFTPEYCARLVRGAVGVPALAIEVVSALPWRVRAHNAGRYREGRVFLAGDAAHAIPPLGAFGMNTGIADAHNLAWKLALVLRGQAGPGLLDSYDAERRPVGAMTVEQATLRLADPRLHWDRSPALAGARRQAGVMNAPVVVTGYRYDSGAIAGPVPALPSTEDITLDLNGDPGSRVPHLRAASATSTLDLIAARFTLLYDACGGYWDGAAGQAGAGLGLEIGCHHVPGLAEATGITADGALLVRPDGFVAWRCAHRSENPHADLERVLRQILD